MRLYKSERPAAQLPISNDTDLFDDALIDVNASATNWITIAVNKVMAMPPRFLRFTGRMLVG